MAAQKNLGKEFPSVLDRAYREFKRHQKVMDIMTSNVVTISPGATMEDAARIMGEKHIGSLLVEEYGTTIAIVTERDLLTRVIAGRMTLAETRVEQIMSYPLVKVCPTLEIREAARTMIHRKGRLAVFECGELTGIITASDLIRSLPEAPETSLKVDEFMTKKVTRIDERMPVSKAADIMGKERIGSVIVTRNNTPKGIFTERDLLTTFLAGGMPLNTPVGEACSISLITAPAGISIHEAARIMTSRHIRRLPLVSKRDLAGIITARDLVEAYAR
jgi:CBS domain-containing protein